MTNQELINKLKEFPPDIEVMISDGYRYNYYTLDKAHFGIFEDAIDIGIGGCEILGEE